MKTNRSLLALILLSIVTFGIYGLWFWHKYAEDMNTVCAGDGKHTRGILARFLFSLLTLGIYDYVWSYAAGERIAEQAHRRGVYCSTTGGSVLLWRLLGSLLFGIGIFVSTYKLINGLNVLCEDYNRRGGKTVSVHVDVNVGGDGEIDEFGGF